MKIVKEISTEGQELKGHIDAVKSQIAWLEEDLCKLIATCNHEFRELTWKEEKDKWMSVGAKCLICGERLGWRCTKSPDHVCHYYSNDGKVVLIDNTVDVPKGHDPN